MRAIVAASKTPPAGAVAALVAEAESVVDAQ
jgi:hypothetical protein